MSDGCFPSGEILFDVAKTEYQNEFDRSNTIDTKVGIALPIIATYFFLVLQYRSIPAIFANPIDMTSVGNAILSIIHPILLVLSLIAAGVSLALLFFSIITHTYSTIDVGYFYDGNKLKDQPTDYAAKMVHYYIEATKLNKETNDKRVQQYKFGWGSAMISLIFFVCYVILTI